MEFLFPLSIPLFLRPTMGTPVTFSLGFPIGDVTVFSGRAPRGPTLCRRGRRPVERLSRHVRDVETRVRRGARLSDSVGRVTKDQEVLNQF